MTLQYIPNWVETISFDPDMDILIGSSNVNYHVHTFTINKNSITNLILPTESIFPMNLPKEVNKITRYLTELYEIVDIDHRPYSEHILQHLLTQG